MGQKISAKNLEKYEGGGGRGDLYIYIAAWPTRPPPRGTAPLEAPVAAPVARRAMVRRAKPLVSLRDSRLCDARVSQP